MSLFNSNIARAIELVRLKRVTNNSEFGFWTVIDENNAPFQVKIFPKAECSCKLVGKSQCVHVLACLRANGQPIDSGYKLPKLSDLTRTKEQGKKSGRKNRGHKKNSLKVKQKSIKQTTQELAKINENDAEDEDMDENDDEDKFDDKVGVERNYEDDSKKGSDDEEDKENG